MSDIFGEYGLFFCSVITTFFIELFDKANGRKIAVNPLASRTTANIVLFCYLVISGIGTG